MKCYVVDTLVGIFAFDESGNILNFMDFNDDDQKIIQFYESLENDVIFNEYETFLLDLKSSGFTNFVYDNKKLEVLSSQKLALETSLVSDSSEIKNFRLNLEDQLKKVGIKKSHFEILAKYKNIEESLIKKKVSQAGAKSDVMIIHIIETLEILKKSISLFSSRLREWYGIHFPELTDKIVEDNIILAKLVSVIGNRENYTLEKLNANFTFREVVLNDLLKKASESMGADIDLKIVQDYAVQILSLDSYREKLESYLEDLMEKQAPNLNSVVGSLIGAKLISKAGSLKKLAYMPASRIQLLGAEKALYRFLKSGEKRPKHGLIFQWNLIRGGRPWLRGKIARLISGKIGLASKVDYFSGGFIGDVLSNEILDKIKDLEIKYPNPLKKVEIKPQKQTKKKSKKKKRKRGVQKNE